ncbi:amidohydrolase [Pseudoalteromonas ruthenica]|uniref:amidohydrolase n=1 Tax=Pseudoalteromonas ruthenica TaxID=151081 RepID=UPI00034A36A4|nr:amidohydrolase [Pseudoalteromonas ruthenica]
MMKNKLVALLMMCSIPCTVLAQTTVIHNIKGYTPTQKGELETFATLVIKDGRVINRGKAQLSKSYPDAKRIDGQGKVLLPGLIDAHGHIIGLGQNLMQLDLRGATSVAEVGKRLQAFAAQSEQPWIIGRGWNQELWPGKTFASAADLDKFVSDRPVVLSRVDGHAIWVNSKAMELAGLDSEVTSPAGGEIIRTAQGNPSGVFIDKAEQLITAHIPKRSEKALATALDKAGQHLLSLGITSAHDAGIDFDTWQLYKQRAKDNNLPLRIYAMLGATDAKLETMLKAGKVDDNEDMLAIRSVKVYADGALGSRGAALLQDYADRKGHRGLMLEDQQQLEDIFSLCFKHGFSAHTHAIGDRANQIVLNAYENVFKRTGGILLRNRIEHAQIVDTDDIPRFKALKIIPSMQPVHATSDMHMAEQRLSDSQLEGAYAWRTFLEQGSRVAAGSDFPVELANPFHGLYSAITRQDHQGLPEQGWRPKELLTREQALRAFTLDAAYSAFQEFKVGSLEKGKWADFILVDTDIIHAPVQQVWQTKVLETWLAGQRRYQRQPAL